MRRAVVGLASIGLVATLALTGCQSDAHSGGRIRVVAAENFWGNIASQIGGDHVSVVSLISDPNIDPHEFETNPQDAAELTNADVVIENGAGYDDFVPKVLATDHSSSRKVLDVQQILDVTGSNPNPHLWYWTTRLPTVARAIALTFAALDPSRKSYFLSNANTFDTSLRPILHVISEIKARYDGDAIAYTERVPGYLVQLAGLHLGTPEAFSMAIENGTEPSPSDSFTFDSDITNHRVEVLLYNSQVTDQQTSRIKSLALSAGVPIVGVSETLPPEYPTFQAWQLAQDRALLAALGKSHS